jgi:hypothetical protein
MSLEEQVARAADADRERQLLEENRKRIQVEIDRILRFALASDDTESKKWAFDRIDRFYNLLLHPYDLQVPQPRRYDNQPFPGRDFQG